MDQLGCKRYCCRRMIMTHVDLIEKLLKYATRYQIFGYSTCRYANGRYRYNPAERDAKKAAMA
jgi:hypothetical protein